MGVIGRRVARWGLLMCLAFLAVLAAAGCTGSGATPQTIYVTPTPGPATPVPATPLPSGVTPGPTAVAPTPTAGPATPVIDSVVISSDAPDSRWTVTFKKPVISGIPAAAATKINDAITTKVNGLIADFTGGGLPAVASGDGPSTLEGDFTIALDSPTLVSLRLTILTYITGSAHPVGAPGSLNFVVSSGAPINLADIFTDQSVALTTLSTQVHTALSTSLGSDLGWAGPAASMSFFDKAWAMTPAGLEFAWRQGDIASMAAGMPSATLAWGAIKTIVKPSSPAGEFVH
jgi:hypothetical protein